MSFIVSLLNKKTVAASSRLITLIKNSSLKAFLLKVVCSRHIIILNGFVCIYQLLEKGIAKASWVQSKHFRRR